MKNLINKKRNILLTESQIQNRIKEVGKKITEDFEGKEIYVLSLLRGSFIFTADLVRNINLPTKIGFMTTSSYENNEESSGKVKVINDICDDIEGCNVIIVDDIIDTGITMNFVINHLKQYNPATIKCCTLLDKPKRRKVELVPDYCCFEIPDVFVVGYGLNYGDYYRNVPYVFNWENVD